MPLLRREAIFPDITLTSGNRALNYYPNIPNVDVTELVDEINEKRPYFDSVYEGAKYGGSKLFCSFHKFYLPDVRQNRHAGSKGNYKISGDLG